MYECLFQNDENSAFILLTSFGLLILLIWAFIKLVSFVHNKYYNKHTKYRATYRKVFSVSKKWIGKPIGYTLLTVLMAALGAFCLFIIYRYGLGLWNFVSCMWEN